MKEINECLNCDCYDEDFGCMMSFFDRDYACSLFENKEKCEELEKLITSHNEMND